MTEKRRGRYPYNYYVWIRHRNSDDVDLEGEYSNKKNALKVAKRYKNSKNECAEVCLENGICIFTTCKER
jgi:hypothetical protein